jgi:hypothetical protein
VRSYGKCGDDEGGGGDGLEIFPPLLVLSPTTSFLKEIGSCIYERYISPYVLRKSDINH